MVIASILQRYQLEPAPSSPAFPEAEPRITLRPKAVTLSIRLRAPQ